MSESDLNFDMPGGGDDEREKKPIPVSVFRFDVRALLISVGLRWRWILGVFLAMVVFTWVFFTFHNSMDKWTAEAKVFHQTRSDRLPSFYKPVDTQTVQQFMGSWEVFQRVGERLGKDVPSDYGKYVEISTGKSRENIITVAASASTPELAAHIANVVAEEGVAEYVKRQNNSVSSQLGDLRKRREDLSKEIVTFDHRMEELHSAGSGLPPNMELDKKRMEISEIIAGRNAAQMKLENVKVRISEGLSLMSQTPKEVEFETVMDNTTALTVEGKEGELQRLSYRYTADNPKIRMLVEEIDAMKEAQKQKREQTPTKVTYRKNDVYAQLEEQLATLSIDKIATESEIRQYDTDITRRREEINALMPTYYKYLDLQRQQDSLRENSTKLSDRINDLEFLIGSAVPDVSVFEPAKPSSASSSGGKLFKVGAISLFAAFLCAMGIAASEIARMRMKASSEFALAFGIENLGELPLPSQVSGAVRESSLQMLCRNLNTLSGSHKCVAFLKFGGDAQFEADIDEILKFNALNGSKAFRLKLIPGSKSSMEDKTQPFEGDKVAPQLISILKVGDVGRFYYQNDYCLEIPERALLKFDLEILASNYDLITLEADCGNNSDYLSSQMAPLSDYVAVVAVFNETQKMVLLRNVSQIQKVSDVKLGGLLLDVPKPFYKR